MDTPRELAAWGDVKVIREIPQSNRASRTWEVEVDGSRAVAKLTYDRRFAVEPGLLVARHVQAHTGVLTGVPIATLDGEVVVEVGDDRAWTLAVIEFVDGEPIERFDDALAHEAGTLLGTVHGALVRSDVPPVPAAVLDWYKSFFKAAEVAAVVERIERHEGLTYGVIYGDPSPEILRAGSGELALIDWGTPSRGPLIHDLAVWERHVGAGMSRAFRAGYFAAAPTNEAEAAALPLLAELFRAH